MLHFMISNMIDIGDNIVIENFGHFPANCRTSNLTERWSQDNDTKFSGLLTCLRTSNLVYR